MPVKFVLLLLSDGCAQYLFGTSFFFRFIPHFAASVVILGKRKWNEKTKQIKG
jgi:hypothetical protein